VQQQVRITTVEHRVPECKGYQTVIVDSFSKESDIRIPNMMETSHTGGNIQLKKFEALKQRLELAELM